MNLFDENGMLIMRAKFEKVEKEPFDIPEHDSQEVKRGITNRTHPQKDRVLNFLLTLNIGEKVSTTYISNILKKPQQSLRQILLHLDEEGYIDYIRSRDGAVSYVILRNKPPENNNESAKPKPKSVKPPEPSELKAETREQKDKFYTTDLSISIYQTRHRILEFLTQFDEGREIEIRDIAKELNISIHVAKHRLKTISEHGMVDYVVRGAPQPSSVIIKNKALYIGKPIDKS